MTAIPNFASDSIGGPTALLAVSGLRARIEGKFDIEDSIEIQCEVGGELNVGSTLIIGESADVSADVTTVNAIIRGRYTGNLKASGSVEITPTGRVSGSIETSELVVGRGAIFTGTVTHVEQAADIVLAPTLKVSAQPATAKIDRQVPVSVISDQRSAGARPTAH